MTETTEHADVYTYRGAFGARRYWLVRGKHPHPRDGYQYVSHFVGSTTHHTSRPDSAGLCFASREAAERWLHRTEGPGPGPIYYEVVSAWLLDSGSRQPLA
jgi:hypothetical protein